MLELNANELDLLKKLLSFASTMVALRDLDALNTLKYKVDKVRAIDEP